MGGTPCFSRMHARALLVLTPLLLVAGCFESSDDTTPAAAPADDDATAIPGAAPSSAPIATDAAAPNATPPEPMPVIIPVSFDGSFANGGGACEFSQVGECVRTPTASDATWTPDAGGSPISVQVEMTWEATSAATETLGVMAMACWETEEGGTCEMFASSGGSSPLTIDASGLDYPEDAVLSLHAYQDCPPAESPAPGTWVWCEVEQAFHLEGTVAVAA